ncbi:hypothetical protein PHYBLDRAFT_142927 [Phycomyces blakesleeanus NRRL 1555(-)]|uniref:Uncharacterized protein n=1 Tax=Phycomyces blakesleeanus (strain ATCC 8743b / DSM 1359 / FGSC 10004 / NBRC 33097 / NRRL 1555) TaxID=763407 RepID=A0A167NHZ5_PHYB8|nr:hypothetical protein PHYBLDRAFT_142927 [Phycomyces blakesleeanus NRRL 1555(-)]OAD75944.1 hypothetical protein PHYBLDRAFT_142927 [Phycomyces blakesleeanus NRRL 1555(-)]|eukprot:XP_018293984.1 hypothetical protein PHYBLDRAFT_142927 [Phycomyces blakesleeanus NRRL 1555(-)]
MYLSSDITSHEDMEMMSPLQSLIGCIAHCTPKVSSSSKNIGGFSHNSGKSVYSPRLPQDLMGIEELGIEAYHIQTLKHKFNNTALIKESVILLVDYIHANCSTNRIYQLDQHLFIA